MADNQETSTSDVVGTDSEYKRIESTLPDNHSAKGLQPIVPLHSGNKKIGKTIGSMAHTRKQTIDINENISNLQKENIQLNENTPNLHKENIQLKENNTRSYKTESNINVNDNRPIKHDELNLNIQKQQKQDQNINDNINHEIKSENNIDQLSSTLQKVEIQLKQRDHVSKNELGIFNTLDHKIKTESIVDDQIKKDEKQEVETNIVEDSLNKNENIINTNQSHDFKTEQKIDSTKPENKDELNINVDNKFPKKQDVEPPISQILDTKLDHEKEINDNHITQDKNYAQTLGQVNFESLNNSTKNNNEKQINDTHLIKDKNYEQTLGSTNFESLNTDNKNNQQTLGTTDFESLNTDNKNNQQTLGTTDFESLNTDNKPIIWDTTFNVNRNLKSGIDGITAESTQEQEIVSNYQFQDYTQPSKQLNNYTYDNILTQFKNSLESDIKSESPDVNSSPIATTNTSTNTPQVEFDHTKTSIVNLNRPKKTQDTNFIEPDNVNDRITEDRSDLSKTTIDENTNINITTNIDYSKRTLGPSDRKNKTSNDLPLNDPNEPMPITEKPGNEIKWDDNGQMGISIFGTLASALRPVGLIHNQFNKLDTVGNLASVAMNDAAPFVNESNVTGVLDAVIPVTPHDKQAGTTNDDLRNYTRHAMINGIRAFSSDILLNTLISYDGKPNSQAASDAIKAAQNLPDTETATKQLEEAIKQGEIQLHPATISQNVRGQIKDDIGGSYSTSTIGKSPAHRYKNFSEYRKALKAQIIQNNVTITGNLNTRATSVINKLNTKEQADEEKLIKKIQTPSGKDAAEINQQNQMIKQFLSFESKLENDNSVVSSTFLYNRSVSENTLFDQIDFTYKDKQNINDPHLLSSLISTTNLKDNKDYTITRRSGKENFKNSDFFKSHTYRNELYGQHETSQNQSTTVKAQFNLIDDYSNGKLIISNYQDDKTIFKLDPIQQTDKLNSSNNKKNIWKQQYDEQVTIETSVLNIDQLDENGTTYKNKLRSLKDIYLENLGYNKNEWVKDDRDRSSALLMYNISSNLDKNVKIESPNKDKINEKAVFDLHPDGEVKLKQGKHNNKTDLRFGYLKYNNSSGYSSLLDNLTQTISDSTTPQEDIENNNIKNYLFNKPLTDDTRESLNNKYESNAIDINQYNDSLKKDDLSVPEIQHGKKSGLQPFENKNNTYQFSLTIPGRHDPTNNTTKFNMFGKDELNAKMSKSMGRIIVNPNPTIGTPGQYWLNDAQGTEYEKATADKTSSGKSLYAIPFQFNPELTSESKQASWSSHTGYGRTNEFYIWNNTSSRQINLKTSYIVTDGTDTSVSSYTKSETTIQYPSIAFARSDGEALVKNKMYNKFNSGFGGWGPGFIHRIIEKYRSLVLPMDLSKPELAVPPVIIIDFNGMFIRYTKHSGTKIFARWIVEDVSVEPIQELGYTQNNFPMGFDVTLTLKEIFNDWGDYQDIKTSLIDNFKKYRAQRG